MGYTPEQIVECYLSLRAKKAALVDEHKKAIAKLDEGMQACENAMLAMMQEQGVESFKTKHGTAFRQTATYVKLEDRDAVIQAVQDGLIDFDIFTSAISKAYVLSLPEPPPGVAITKELEVHFRKAA